MHRGNPALMTSDQLLAAHLVAKVRVGERLKELDSEKLRLTQIVTEIHSRKLSDRAGLFSPATEVDHG